MRTRSLALSSATAVVAAVLTASGVSAASGLRQSSSSGPTASEVFLAFDVPPPVNASDPCRTGTDYKQNEVGDHDDITVCTFDSAGNPVPTLGSSDHLVWTITDVNGALSGAIAFSAGPPSETSGAAGTSPADVIAVHPGEVLIGVRLVNGSGFVVDSAFLEKQVGDPCPEPVGENASGGIPSGAVDVEGPVDVEEDLGPVGSLYPGLDTSTDAYYDSLPCDPSIDAGALPPDATVPPSDDELEVEGFVHEFVENEVPGIIDKIKGGGAVKFPKLADVPRRPGPCYLNAPPGLLGSKKVPCDSRAFLQADQPFEGRDVVYVHGLALQHLKQWPFKLAARAKWPAKSGEYLSTNGYFRKYAERYWRDHIREHLFDPTQPTNTVAGIDWSSGSPVYKPKSNRYLAVAWSSNQTLEYAQHAFLQQVALAIQSNQNVVTSPVYPSKFFRPFGSNGLVIVTHSTGALVVTTALARAADGDFGPAGRRIARQALLHVSFTGAISGSNLAVVGMAVGLAGSGSAIPQSVCTVAALMEVLCGANTSYVLHSILRDLMPPVAQLVWGADVNDSPVPTVTVAGGHPTGNYALGASKIVLPGLDDGVVSMNSACGNPNLVYPGLLPPSGATVTSYVKAFDRHLPVRGAKNFISHLHFQAPPSTHPFGKFLAGGCTPHLSPTGMLMPLSDDLAGTQWDARDRYDNQFSFIQGSIDHSYEGGGDSSNPWPSASGVASSVNTPRSYLPTNLYGPNCEEMSAVTDSGIYQKFADGTYLVKPSFQNEMHQVVRGRKITFKLFKKSKKTYTRWIWRRNYFLLGGTDCAKSSSHYVYQYVGRR